MTSDQVKLLQQLMRAALRDLGLAYSATWSKSRLHSVLVAQCLLEGHRVIERVVPGTPAHLHQVNQAGASLEQPDLRISHKDGDRLLYVDLLAGSLQGWHADHLDLEAVHRAVSRVHQGQIDAMLIAADAGAYDQVRESGPEGQASQCRVVAAVLPRSDILSASAHRKVLGDITLETVGTSFTAFGVPRVVSATYVLPY